MSPFCLRIVEKQFWFFSLFFCRIDRNLINCGKQQSSLVKYFHEKNQYQRIIDYSHTEKIDSWIVSFISLRYSRSVGAKHYHTTAKLNKGIEEMFLDLTKRKFYLRSSLVIFANTTYEWELYMNFERV